MKALVVNPDNFEDMSSTPRTVMVEGENILSQAICKFGGWKLG